MTDSREAFDALLGDATATQKANGKMPTPQEAADFLRPFMETAERKLADAKPDAPATPRVQDPEEKLAQMQAAYLAKGGTGSLSITNGKPIKSKRPEHEKRIDTVELTPGQKRRLKMRVRRMTERDAQGNPLYPELVQRLKDAMGYAASAISEQRCKGLVKLTEVLNDSNRYFGDWTKPAGKRAWGSGSGKRGTIQQ